MNDVSDTLETVRVRVDWTATETAKALHVNQAIGQVAAPGSDGVPDGIYVTLGSVPPPAILAENAADQARVIEELKSKGVKVNVVGQFHMSRQMLTDFIVVLQETAAKYDTAVDQYRQTQQPESESR